MRESCLYGSARGVLGNRHSYRNCCITLQRYLIFSHVLSFICPFHHAHTVLDQDG